MLIPMLSTPHLTEDARAAALDPAGGGVLGETARAHAAVCERCRAMLEADVAAEQQAQKLLQMLDHPMLHIDFEQVKAIAAAYNAPSHATAHAPQSAEYARMQIPVYADTSTGASELRGSRGRTPSLRMPSVGTRIDAGATRVWRWGWRGIGVVAFGTGAVAAALVPDSAAHRFVARVMDRMVSSIAPKAPSTPPASPDLGTADAQRGVSIVPSGPVTIAFQMARPAGMIHIMYGSSSHITVQGSAAGATYAVGPDGIQVDNRGAGSLNYTIELPPLERSVPVKILVGDVVLYSAADGRVTVPASSQPEASYELPLGNHGTTH